MCQKYRGWEVPFPEQFAVHIWETGFIAGGFPFTADGCHRVLDYAGSGLLVEKEAWRRLGLLLCWPTHWRYLAVHQTATKIALKHRTKTPH
jgi:hypothetical protein